MNTPKTRLISAIKRGKINPEAIMERGYYYGEKCAVMPLKCSYGQIGYVFYFPEECVTWDYEINKVTTE